LPPIHNARADHISVPQSKDEAWTGSKKAEWKGTTFFIRKKNLFFPSLTSTAHKSSSLEQALNLAHAKKKNFIN
jgi:hypothetical protein